MNASAELRRGSYAATDYESVFLLTLRLNKPCISFQRDLLLLEPVAGSVNGRINTGVSTRPLQLTQLPSASMNIQQRQGFFWEAKLPVHAVIIRLTVEAKAQQGLTEIQLLL